MKKENGPHCFKTRTSLKSEWKIHSSTYFGGSIDFVGTKLLQVQIKIPNERINIFDASVDFLSYKDGQYQPVTSYQKENIIQKHCTPDPLNTVTGLQGCGQVSFFHGQNKGDPHWFFAGPSRASLWFQKTDTFKSLIAKYAWVTDKTGSVNDISLVYDTPGSQSNRKTIFKINYDDRKTLFDLDLIIPVLGFKFGLNYDWTERRKVFTFGVSLGNKDIVRVTTQLMKYNNKFEGVAKLTFYEDKILHWESKLHMKPRKYSFSTSLQSKFHDEMILSGDITRLQNTGKLKIKDWLWHQASYFLTSVWTLGLKKTFLA